MTARPLMSMAEIDPRDEVFNLEQAAEFLRISPTALRQSDVPRSKFGTRVLFLRSKLLRYVADHETGRATG